MLSRPGEDRPHGVKTVDTRSQAQCGFMTVFARQVAHFGTPDVGRVAHDDIVTAARHGGEMIRVHNPDPLRQSQAADVSATDRERTGGDIDRVHGGAGKGDGAGQGEGARAATDIQYSAYAARSCPRSEALEYQLRHG